MAHAPERTADPADDAPFPDALFVDVGHLPSTIASALRLLAETVLVPTAILYACMHTVGAVPGLCAVVGWCLLTTAVRLARHGRVPSTMVLVVSMLVARTLISIAFSSVYVYLLQPVAASVLMAVLFLGSVVLGRPLAMRLAADFVTLPARLLADLRVRRLFVEVSLIWGVSRLLDAGLSLGSLHWGLDAGVLSRGALSTVLTILSVGACGWWGWRRLSRIPGVRIRVGTVPSPA